MELPTSSYSRLLIILMSEKTLMWVCSPFRISSVFTAKILTCRSRKSTGGFVKVVHLHYVP